MITREVAVLVSGRGSNMESLIKYSLDKNSPYRISLVISDKPDAIALEKAGLYGVKTISISPSRFSGRVSFEKHLVKVLKSHHIEIIALAGFMRIVGSTLLEAFPNRILNIHPSLLPSFKGLDAQEQALNYGVKKSGCTVHIVDKGVDSGAILGQVTVNVEDNDTAKSLSKRILEKEHQLFPQILSRYSMGEYRFNGRIVKYADFSKCNSQTLDLFKKTHFGSGMELAIASTRSSNKKAIGVSACLLGIPCRYDGNSKPSEIIKKLNDFKLIPVCPEVLAGFGIPRTSMEYKTGDGRDLADEGVLTDLNGKKTNLPMISGCKKGAKLLKDAGVTHAFLKARSPSCGIKSIYRNGKIAPGIGAFAHTLDTMGFSTISEEQELVMEEFIKSAKL